MIEKLARMAGVVLLLAVVLGMGACGRKGPRSPSSPWKEEYRPYFDDAVDTVGDLSRIKGQWAEDQKKQLEGRSYFSDLVAKGNIASIRTVIDADGRQLKIITVKFIAVLYGDAQGESLDVTCGEDQPGYAQLEQYERERGPAMDFLLFVKWYEKKDEVLFHYHLQASDSAVDVLVETLVDKRKSEERKAREAYPR